MAIFPTARGFLLLPMDAWTANLKQRHFQISAILFRLSWQRFATIATFVSARWLADRARITIPRTSLATLPGNVWWLASGSASQRNHSTALVCPYERNHTFISPIYDTWRIHRVCNSNVHICCDVCDPAQSRGSQCGIKNCRGGYGFWRSFCSNLLVTRWILRYWGVRRGGMVVTV